MLDAFSADPDYATAFDGLTRGRQRSYIIHINASKKPETRANRIAKSRDKGLKGKGLLER
ncbi:YdeI/OmpD-associated family protein [Yoonia sp. F2084L]|nr:YdeI/OmpD-associated family protein [Yoonia sp. F2084L]